MVATGVALGDVLADSGYAHRVATAWALPLRQLGARLVQDLHPHDRGPKGTHAGATIANVRLYCPCAPPALLSVVPLARAASAQDTAAHDTATAEAARDYPSAAHRRSYARRSAAERTFSTLKDPATTDINRGWCRLMGLSAVTLFFTCAMVVRNQRVLGAFEARSADDARRLAAGQPPRTRRPIAELVKAAPP